MEQKAEEKHSYHNLSNLIRKIRCTSGMGKFESTFSRSDPSNHLTFIEKEVVRNS